MILKTTGSQHGFPKWKSRYEKLPPIRIQHTTAFSHAKVMKTTSSNLLVRGLNITKIFKVFDTSSIRSAASRDSTALRAFVRQCLDTGRFDRNEIVKQLASSLIMRTSLLRISHLTDEWPVPDPQHTYQAIVERILESTDEDTNNLRQTDHWHRMVRNDILQLTREGSSLAMTNDGDLLVGPKCTEAGDTIVVLVGLNDPVVLRMTAMATYKVIGTCLITRFDYGQALVGDFADDWHLVRTCTNGAHHHLSTTFKNWTTGEYTALDPRIHWTDLSVDENDPRVDLAMQEAGWGSYRVPDAEYFEKSHGIKFQDFELV